jgi:predicted extracellular nuclease
MPANLVRRFGALFGALLLVVSGLPAGIAPAAAVSPNIVIGQVYGGGGNAGATYTHDFVELFNRGPFPASLAGWSIQYASATGTGNFGATSTQLTELPNVTLAPGQYFLIQEAQGSGGTTALPTPDLIDATPIAMSATGGKVALANIATTLGCNGGSTPCTPTQLAQIVDLVGWDGANFFEGTVAPATTNTTGILRNSNGCADTDNNALDFTAGAPAPRNAASPLSPCGAPDAAPTVVSTYPVNGATDFPVGSNPTVTFGEPVNVTDPWFTLVCSTSGTVPAAVSGGPTIFTLDPAANLVNGESCTLTIFATNVTDQDTNDPPDNMATNVAVGFTPFDVCAEPFTPIYTIQGSGPSTPIPGTVTTKGVVVGDFEGTAAASGFYLQDLTGDGDIATSDGIFVFTGSGNLVSVGQVVRVTGYARERFNQTTLNGTNSNSSAVPAANIVQCGTGSVAATDVNMPFASADDPERFEGMLVRFPQSLVIAEYFNYDRFGEIVLGLPLDGEARPFTGTAIDEPGAPANARTLANSLRRITLDDAQSAQNPPTLRHPNGDPFSLTNRFRGGDTVQDAVGVLGYDFSLYRIIPTGPADYTAANPRPAAPEPVGGTIRAAAMNTLNFFVTPDYPTGNPLDNKCGPLKNVECRGWDSDQPTEFTRQRAKLLAAITGLDADIVGLNELENTTGVEPLADIVSDLNDPLGAGTYAYINTGVIGTDAIKVGLIYRPAEVTPVGSFSILDSTDDPRFIDTKSRPVLAQAFQVNATGARFTVAVNHLKSKGSACDDVGDPDMGDGQGNCNGTRTLAAQALVDWLATDPTGSGDPDFLVLGDLNSYAQEDPIDAIKVGPDDTAGTADDYTNLISHYLGTYAYSYVFDGQAGYLDHALASASLFGQTTGATEWHINADEPDVLDYDTSFKPAAQDALYESNAYRSSDHDPVMVGLNLVNYPPELGDIAVTPSLLAVGGPVAASVPFTDPDKLDTHTAVWDWGDGTTTPGTVTESNGSGTIAGSHVYTTAGVYTVTVTADDGYGNTDRASYEFVVVYDPNGGFATGGGWITTPAGAYEPDPSAEGKSAIGFVARYLPGATVPTGSLAFTFHAAGFQFKSRSFDWLVVTGSKAQLRGAGTVNGAGTYEFLLVAEDGRPDRLSLKIWETDPTDPIYDASKRPLKGSIIVHKGK